MMIARDLGHAGAVKMYRESPAIFTSLPVSVSVMQIP